MTSPRSQLSFPALLIRSVLTVSAIAAIYVLQQLHDSDTSGQISLISQQSKTSLLGFLR